MITVTPLQQPTPVSCAHTCLAMVTGVSVESLIERFGNRPLGFGEEASVLVEHGIFPVKTTGDNHQFAFQGVYFVSAPSLNLPGKLHMVVAETCMETIVVHDPNTGREGVQAYAPDALIVGDMARCEVTYLDTRILFEMRKEAKRRQSQEPAHDRLASPSPSPDQPVEHASHD